MDTKLATNLLGILFLDVPSGNSANFGNIGINIPSLTKLQSGPTGFGTSYSFRLNIKTDSILDNTQAVIYDESTSAQLMAEDFIEVFNNLNIAVETLGKQASTVNYISNQYNVIIDNEAQLTNDIRTLEEKFNDVNSDITGPAGNIPMYSGEGLDGDPLIESSIYMTSSRQIGFFNNNPTWPIQMDASLKTKDIYLEKAIRDVSGNILLSYGSPLQIGANSNYKPIHFYVGGPTPVFIIDTSISVPVDLWVSRIFQNGIPIGNPSDGMWHWDLANGRYTAYAQKSDIGVGVLGYGKWYFDSSLNMMPSSAASTLNYNGALRAYNLNATSIVSGAYLQSTGGIAGGNFYMQHDTEYDSVIDVFTTGGIPFLFESSIYIQGFDPLNNDNMVMTKKYIDTKEPAYGNADYDGAVMVYNIDGTRSWHIMWGDVGLAYVDASLMIRDASITNIFLKNYSQDSSIISIKNILNAWLQADGLHLPQTAGTKLVTMGEVASNTSNQLNIQGQSAIYMDGGLTTTGGNVLVAAGDAQNRRYYGNMGTVVPGNLYLYEGQGIEGPDQLEVFPYTVINYGKIYIGRNSTTSTALLSKGSSTTPGLGWQSDTQTGLFWESAGRFGITMQGTQRFRFDSSTFLANGDVVGFYNSFSDIRLKTNIIKLENSLDKVCKMNGVQYELIKNKGVKHFGFIAQDVEEIIPEVVVEHEMIGEDEKYKTIRYTEIIPYLVESIKELKTQIDILKEELSQYKK